MQHKVPENEYAMLAVIATDNKIIEETCEEIRNNGKFVVPANYNYSAQTVISGIKEAVDEAEMILKEKGATKLIRLKNTSGPFHTTLLEDARKEYEEILKQVSFSNPKKKVYRNIDGNEYQKDDDMRAFLGKHIVSPVRFDHIIKNMIKDGVDTFIEIGPGKSLAGFIKREIPDSNMINIYDVPTLEEAIEKLKVK